MKGFFEPESVAVIGASDTAGKGGYNLVANLREDPEREVFPVNPNYREIQGLPCYESVEALPGTVDLAIVFIRSSAVPAVVEACGRKGIRRVMIQGAGFAEAGEGGRLLQEECLSIARNYEMRLWGPNCMGVVDGRSKMVASFMRPDIWKGALKAGGVSLIVQSGMLSAGFLMQILNEGYFGLSKACSIGNRCDVNECDLLEYFSEDPGTEVIALYLEGIVDPPRFREVISRLKQPVVLLKGGISSEGARAAMSHTASLAGNLEVAEGFFQQLGIHRAWDFKEYMDFSKALTHWQGKAGGRRVAVATFSGAAGIVTADHLARQGMTLADLTGRTLEGLARIFPSWIKPENPVDMWPAIERNGPRKAYGRTLELLVEDDEVDAIFLHLFVDAQSVELASELLRPLQDCSKPMALWPIGDTHQFRALRDRIEPMGIPVFEEIERASRALKLLSRRSERA